MPRVITYIITTFLATSAFAAIPEIKYESSKISEIKFKLPENCEVLFKYNSEEVLISEQMNCEKNQNNYTINYLDGKDKVFVYQDSYQIQKKYLNKTGEFKDYTRIETTKNNQIFSQDAIYQPLGKETKKATSVAKNTINSIWTWITNFYSNTKAYLMANKQGYIESSKGNFWISKSCLKDYPINKIENIFLETLTESYSCLNRVNPLNQARFYSLTNQRGAPLKIDCSDNINSPESVIAWAESPWNTKAPLMNINPYALNSGKSMEENKKTIFHELFHSIGIVHYADIEYAYSCEVCCFNYEGYSDDIQNNACNICKGNYKDINDVKYIQAVSSFYADTNRKILNERTLRYSLSYNLSKELLFMFFHQFEQTAGNYYFLAKFKSLIENTKGFKPANEKEIANMHLKAKFEIKDLKDDAASEKTQEKLASNYFNFLFKKVALKEIYQEVKNLDTSKNKELENIRTNLLWDIGIQAHNSEINK